MELLLADSSRDSIQQLPHFSRVHVPHMLRVPPDTQGYVYQCFNHLTEAYQSEVHRSQRLRSSQKQQYSWDLGPWKQLSPSKTNERSPTFAKQSIIDLSPSAKELLAKWDIDQDEYTSTSQSDATDVAIMLSKNNITATKTCTHNNTIGAKFVIVSWVS